MSEFAARISRVRMKSGGADVRVLRNHRVEEGGEDFRGALMQNARRVAEYGDATPLAGYVLVGIFDDGSTSVGYRYNFENERAIPRTLLPAWIAEVMRRDLISAEEARSTFDDMFQWVDG